MNYLQQVDVQDYKDKASFALENATQSAMQLKSKALDWLQTFN